VGAHRAQFGDMVLISCEWCTKHLHQNSPMSLHTHRVSLASGASKPTIRSTFSQLRIRSVHTFRVRYLSEDPKLSEIFSEMDSWGVVLNMPQVASV
jgi:hypothetical protein